MDTVTKQKRSEMMASIKAKGTKPEMIVRKLLFAMRYRFRLHIKRLPGSPDIVLRKHSLCIFVNGCYWHHHKGCSLAYIPETRKDFWAGKFRQNIQRDISNYRALLELGWRVLVVWECATRNLPEDLLVKLLNDAIYTSVSYQEITYV